MKNLTLVMLLSMAVLSCKNAEKADNENVQTVDTTLCGGDKDAHGCIGSAGYTWCEVLGECVRTWEKGIKMLPIEKDSTGAVMVAYAVFAQDSTRAEIFMPNMEQNEYSILEKRTLPNGSSVWNVEDDDTFTLKKDEKGQWCISRRGGVLFVQK